jgi:competence protein ComEC
VAPRRAAAACALPIAIAYTLVTGGQVATVRALVVVVVMLVGELVERRARLGDALGLAALAAIAWRPSVVWDPAFELSFVAAITLARSRPRRTSTTRRRAGAARWRGWAQAIRASWCVTVATAPITAWHFGQVSFGGVIGNLIVGPAFELVTLPLAVVGTALALRRRSAAWCSTPRSRSPGGPRGPSRGSRR